MDTPRKQHRNKEPKRQILRRVKEKQKMDNVEGPTPPKHKKGPLATRIL
jgi:hypothetical protein